MGVARVVLVIVFVVVGTAATKGGAVPGIGPAEVGVSAEQRAAGFTYGPSVTEYDKQLIGAAIASAEPLAQQLIAEIDGVTTVQVGPPPGGAAGLAEGNPDAFTVTLDIPTVSSRLGPRGVNRLVLHELGHVVDFVLVPDDMKARLDAGVPTCLGGAQPGCTDRAERFAESFAKWAMRDIGVNLYIGYAVPPPANLATWAAPLAQLAA